MDLHYTTLVSPGSPCRLVIKAGNLLYKCQLTVPSLILFQFVKLYKCGIETVFWLEESLNGLFRSTILLTLMSGPCCTYDSTAASFCKTGLH